MLTMAMLTAGVAQAEGVIPNEQTAMASQMMPFPQAPDMNAPTSSHEIRDSRIPTAHKAAGSGRQPGSVKHDLSSSKKSPGTGSVFLEGSSSHDTASRLSEMVKRGEILDAPVTVLPEVATPVDLSASDINRITCASEIKDIVYSKEKGLIVKFAGNNAFVKFLIRKSEDKEIYATLPSEMYVVCGDNVYNIIAFPKRLPGRTVRLSSGSMEKIKKNNSAYGAIPFEKKILSILKSVYTDEIPDSFLVKNENRSFPVFQNININLSRLISVEGEGLRIKEYHVSVHKDAPGKIELREKQFLRNDLSTKPIAVSIDNPILKPGQTARVFIFESVAERNSEVAE